MHRKMRIGGYTEACIIFTVLCQQSWVHLLDPKSPQGIDRVGLLNLGDNITLAHTVIVMLYKSRLPLHSNRIISIAKMNGDISFPITEGKTKHLWHKHTNRQFWYNSWHHLILVTFSKNFITIGHTFCYNNK